MTLTNLLNQTITLSTFNSTDKYGDCSYNSPVSYKARVERRIKIVRSMQGMEAVSTAAIYLDGTVSLDSKGRDKITLPDGSTPIILAISDGIDGGGATYYTEVST